MILFPTISWPCLVTFKTFISLNCFPPDNRAMVIWIFFFLSAVDKRKIPVIWLLTVRPPTGEKENYNNNQYLNQWSEKKKLAWSFEEGSEVW